MLEVKLLYVIAKNIHYNTRVKMKASEAIQITEEYINQNTDYKDIDDFVDKFFKHDAKLSDLNIKKFFRLKPPSKGYERKGVKTAYKEGGALGYRGEEINQLLIRMI